MNKVVCKHQDRVFDTNSGITISACRCPECLRIHDIVSELICDACQFRSELDEDDLKIAVSLNDAYGFAELETRPLAERERLLNTYCFKCDHCDATSKVCNVCSCSMQLPVDEYVKYTNFHCSLELW